MAGRRSIRRSRSFTPGRRRSDARRCDRRDRALAYRDGFNATPSPTLAAHAIKAACAQAGLDQAKVDDVILGCSLPQGVQQSVGRNAALRAGLPASVAGMTIDRQCSSGLMTIATAAKQIIVDRMDVVVAGGVGSISMVQTGDLGFGSDQELLEMVPDIYMPVVETAEVVAERSGISRERPDAYALLSQLRTADAQHAGAFDNEIVAVNATAMGKDRVTGETTMRKTTLTKTREIAPRHRRRVLQPCPRSFELRNALPLSAAGRILKPDLRASFWALS